MRRNLLWTAEALGALRIAVGLLPLLSGEISVSSITLEKCGGATVDAAALRSVSLTVVSPSLPAS